MYHICVRYYKELINTIVKETLNDDSTAEAYGLATIKALGDGLKISNVESYIYVASGECAIQDLE